MKPASAQPPYVQPTIADAGNETPLGPAPVGATTYVDAINATPKPQRITRINAHPVGGKAFRELATVDATTYARNHLRRIH